MLLTGSLFRFTGYLQAPFFDLHVIDRLPFFDLQVIYRLPFSIYMLFTGSLFKFTCYLQAPLFDLHDVYRLPFWIYMLFTGSLFGFTCCLQAPFLIYMLLTCYLQYFDNLLALNLHVFLQVLWLNHKKFTAYLQYSQR